MGRKELSSSIMLIAVKLCLPGQQITPIGCEITLMPKKSADMIAENANFYVNNFK